MLSTLDPVECYYANDHYLAQIALVDKPSKTKGIYSPKALIKGYWKKDYSDFIQEHTPQKYPSLPQITNKKKIKKKQSYSNLSHKLLNISNCFESLTKRQQITDEKVKRDYFQIPKIQSRYQLKYYSKEKKHISGKLCKGYILSPDPQIQSPEPQSPKSLQKSEELIKIALNNKKCNTQIQKDSGSGSQTERSINININQSLKSLSYSKDRILNQQRLPSHTEKNRQKQLNPFSNPIIIRRATQQKNVLQMQFKNIKPLHGLKLTCKLHKITSSNHNLVIIFFDGILGYNEHSYFGYNTDFIQSPVNEEYELLRNYNFQLLDPHKDIYIMKNLKELFQSISKIYQLVIITTPYETQSLIHYVREKNLRINGIFEIDYQTQNNILDISTIYESLKISHSQQIIFIQSLESFEQGQQTQQKVESSKNISYQGQKYYIPYSKEFDDTNYRILFLPQLKMQKLFRREESYKSFINTNYFIEQFLLALQNEHHFQDYLQRYNSKIKIIEFGEYFRNTRQQILQKLHKIDQLQSNQQELKNQVTINKKELIKKISQKFDEQMVTDLVMRNKKIIKNLRNYKQGNQNDLKQVQQELEYQLDFLNYSELFLDKFYYLQY